jgi:uncharacterized protein YjbJ (UPF0337 family)
MGELIDTVKGKIKQAEGRATGNKAKEAEGLVDELKGKAKGAFEEAKTDIKRAAREARDDTRSQDDKRPEAEKTIERPSTSSRR